MSQITRLRYTVYGASRWNGISGAYGAFACVFQPEESELVEILVGGISAPVVRIEVLGRIAELHAIRNALREAVGKCQEIQRRRPECVLEVMVYTATRHAYSCMEKMLNKPPDIYWNDLAAIAVAYQSKMREIVQFAGQIQDLGARIVILHHVTEPNLVAQGVVHEKMNEIGESSLLPMRYSY